MHHIQKSAQQLLLQVKQYQSTDELEAQLQRYALDQLAADLSGDVQKKAFWINIYNAFFQLLRRKGINKPAIFRDRLIPIAGGLFSLDDIEHGILRRSRTKWSLGYWSNPFAPAPIRRLAVRRVDYRIHFALNCGAKSCPPIAFYTPEKLEQQLELATRTFLETETKVDEDNRTIYLTALMKWFLADFGGLRGIRHILKEKLNIESRGMGIRFRPYDWEEELDNFIS